MYRPAPSVERNAASRHHVARHARRVRRPPAPVLALLVTLCVLIPALAAASVYGFLDQGAIRYFRGDDARLMSENLDAVLANPADKVPRDWRNPATGSHGQAEALRTFEHDGMHCRRVRVTNHARGVDGMSTADMCEVDGTWKVLRLPE
jgi:surface antigen